MVATIRAAATANSAERKLVVVRSKREDCDGRVWTLAFDEE